MKGSCEVCTCEMDKRGQREKDRWSEKRHAYNNVVDGLLVSYPRLLAGDEVKVATPKSLPPYRCQMTEISLMR